MQAPVVGRQHRSGRVVAHRADRLPRVQDHRREQQLEILDRDPELMLTAAQLRPLHMAGREGPPGRQIIEVGDVLDPPAVWLLARQEVLELVVAIEPARLEIDADHLAGADPALLDDPRFRERHHAGLRADHQQAVLGPGVAHRAQPVAIHAADHPVAVRGDHRGRPVPWLHHAVAVAEQILMRLGDRHLLGPGGRDQQRLGEGQRAARADQGFDHGIERGAVRAARLDDRLDVLVELAEGRLDHARLVALHPVEIAAQGVDLAVVGEHAERLGERPGRPGIGRVALMEDREARDEPLVLQIGVEHRELLGQEQALVDHRPTGQRADVETVDVLGEHLVLDPPPDQEQLALEVTVIHPLRIADDDLLDLGPGRNRLLADHRGVDRHLAPA